MIRHPRRADALMGGILVDKSDTGYGAFVPDLPGCVAVAETSTAVRTLIRQAIELHLEAEQPRVPDRIRQEFSSHEPMKPTFSPIQGQYLAFIYYYTRLNRVAPAEADFVRYFGVSAPSVHAMIKKLEADGWISRTPGQSRSIRLRVTREQLPELE